MYWQLSRLCKRFIRIKRGTATVEFALTIVIFLAILGVFVELARLSLLSAHLDSALALSTRAAKNAEDSKGQSYEQIVKKYLKEERKLWKWLDNGEITVKVNYYQDINQYIANAKSGSSRNQPLAEYNVNYRYTPMFSWLPRDTVSAMLSRKVLVLQEHERDQKN